MLYRNRHPATPALSLITWLAVAVTFPQPVAARSLMDCEQSVRVGNRLLLAGDDGQRARKVLAKHPQWEIQRRSKSQMVWTRSGRNPATLRLKLKDGEISAICLRG